MSTDLAMYIMLGDLFVTGVNFTEDQMQVSYLQNRRQQVESAIMETMMINLDGNERWKETFISLQETLKDLVDDVFVHQDSEGKPQRTAQTKSPAERMAQAREEAEYRERLGLKDPE